MKNHEILGNQDIEMISIEHQHIKKELLPPSLKKSFPNGACTIFVDENFTFALPATAKQTDELAALVDDVEEYKAYRRALLEDGPANIASKFFLQEMEKQRQYEEQQEQRRATNGFIKRATTH